MECSICFYKASKGWLLKRHQESNKKCKQIKFEQNLHIKYNSEIEFYKLQQTKLEEQIRQLKLENYKLKFKCNELCDFLVFNKSDLNKDQLEQINSNIVQSNDFEQNIKYIFHQIYFKNELIKCGIKITDKSRKKCSILNSQEWISTSFEKIINDLWICLIKPLFEEIKKDWCSYGHHKRLNKIIFEIFNLN